jgi:hypothetical protein
VSTNPESQNPAADLTEWAEVVAAAIRAIRSDDPRRILADPEHVAHVIRSARSLAVASGAVMDAMVRIGRADDPDGRAPLMSWGQLATAFGHNRPSIQQRHKKITAPDYQRPSEDLWLYGL